MPARQLEPRQNGVGDDLLHRSHTQRQRLSSVICHSGVRVREVFDHGPEVQGPLLGLTLARMIGRMVSWSGQRSSWDAALFSAVLALAHAYKTCETKHSHHVCSAGARCVNEKVWEANLNDLTCGPPQAWKVAAVKGLLAAATPQTRGSFALQRRQVLSKTKSSASKGSKRKAKDFTKVKNKVAAVAF